MKEAELKRGVLKLTREDQEFRYAVAGLIGLDETLKQLDRHDQKFIEVLESLDRHGTELIKLREDINKGFSLVERHLSALGARWGLMSEETRELTYVAELSAPRCVQDATSLFPGSSKAL